MKIVTAAAAIENGVTGLEIDCTGSDIIEGQKIPCPKKMCIRDRISELCEKPVLHNGCVEKTGLFSAVSEFIHKMGD